MATLRSLPWDHPDANPIADLKAYADGAQEAHDRLIEQQMEMVDMATKNQVKAALRKKKRAGLLPPQVCGNDRCKADLHDPDVPKQYALYREMFSLALERLVDIGKAVWECPVCGWRSAPHAPTESEGRYR